MATLSQIRAEKGDFIPAGAVKSYAGSSIPSGWLLADGSDISRTTYVSLFNAIGTTYGVGDGSTTFTLPDLRGEFLRGADNGRGTDTAGPAPGPRALGSFQDHQYGQHLHSSGTLSANTVNAPHDHASVSVPANNAPHDHQPGTSGDVDSLTRFNTTGPGANFGWANASAPVNPNSGTATRNVTVTMATDNAPHSHTGASAAADNAPHGHPALAGSVAASGGTPNTNETRPRNVAMHFIIKY